MRMKRLLGLVFPASRRVLGQANYTWPCIRLALGLAGLIGHGLEVVGLEIACRAPIGFGQASTATGLKLLGLAQHGLLGLLVAIDVRRRHRCPNRLRDRLDARHPPWVGVCLRLWER